MGEHAGAGRGDGLEHRGRRLEGRLRGEVPAGLHPQADHEQVEWRLRARVEGLLTHLIVVGRLWTRSSFWEMMPSASQLPAAGDSEEDSEAIEVMSS